MNNDLIKRIDAVFAGTENYILDVLTDCRAEIERLSKPYVPMTTAEPVEPVAWINVEKRKLEWNTDFPVRWETPTVVKLEKLPLYTTPPSVDALIAEAVAKEREACAQIADGFYGHIRQYTTDVPEIGFAIRARGKK